MLYHRGIQILTCHFKSNVHTSLYLWDHCTIMLRVSISFVFCTFFIDREHLLHILLLLVYLWSYLFLMSFSLPFYFYTMNLYGLILMPVWTVWLGFELARVKEDVVSFLLCTITVFFFNIANVFHTEAKDLVRTPTDEL